MTKPHNDRRAGLSPAALAAAVRGDFENFLVASSPGGIERQEAAGQAAFVGFRDSLPIEGSISGAFGRAASKDALEEMGFVFGEKIDDLFVACQLPTGWHKRATDHSMWSELLDDKGRKRAMIFYKAAFYDREAYLTLECRYGTDTRYPSEATGDHERRQMLVTDSATGEKVFDAGIAEGYEAAYQKRDACEAWLNENKPEWKDPTAYWD